ncbi:MAG: hypothetical protein HZC55_26805 [Verrucomicrobia bacterium]|nr:hypothetical protein [Verrucomicrobiota bacterium]
MPGVPAAAPVAAKPLQLPPVPAGTPAAIQPPPESIAPPPARTRTPDFVRPNNDERYFKQLKRF